MRINWNDSSVRLVGRWSKLEKDWEDVYATRNASAHAATSTAPGSWFEVAFQGEQALLEFDVGYHVNPMPHLWISVDDGACVEACVDRYVRIQAVGDGNHVATVVFKSTVEDWSRWYMPLINMVSFAGYHAAAPGVLPRETRKLVEFLGDSITEGIQMDPELADPGVNIQFSLPLVDDSMATYAFVACKMLNLRCMFQAYGAVGTTRVGSGSVPSAPDIYPYVYDRIPYTGEKPDCVVINHGTNDRKADPEVFRKRYREYLQLIRKTNPEALMICLTPFCGAHDDDIRGIVEEFRAKGDLKLRYVKGGGIVPTEPLHPNRAGHRKIAEYFAPILKDLLTEYSILG